MKDKKKYRESLITKLSALSIEGPSRGGPYAGIKHNEVTRSIVAEGEEIIPLLLNKLETINLNGTIYIVFCLRKLHAKRSKAKIRQLQQSKRFSNIEKDMTLEMQIKFFLRDVDFW